MQGHLSKILTNPIRKQTAPVCIGELSFLDLDAKTFDQIEVDIIDSILFTFNTEQLTLNRHYNVTVNASNVAGSTLSPPITIST